MRAIEAERREVTRHIVESAHAIAARYPAVEAGGALSRAEAQTRAPESLRAIRSRSNE